jgi:hypothetical protein
VDFGNVGISLSDIILLVAGGTAVFKLKMETKVCGFLCFFDSETNALYGDFVMNFLSSVDFRTIYHFSWPQKPSFIIWVAIIPLVHSMLTATRETI